MNIIKQMSVIKCLNMDEQISKIDNTNNTNNTDKTNTIKQIDIIYDKHNINMLRKLNEHIFKKFSVENQNLLSDEQLIEINKKTINCVNNQLNSIQYNNNYEKQYNHEVSRIYWHNGCKPEQFKYILDPIKKTQQIYQYDFISNECFEIYTNPDYGFEIMRGVFVGLFFWNPFAWMAYDSSPIIISKKKVQNNIICNLVRNEIENKIASCNEKIIDTINEKIYELNENEIISYIATMTESNDSIKQYLRIKNCLTGISGFAFAN